MTHATIRAQQQDPIPDWALRQRHLIDVMNEAAPIFQERYTRADGTYIWRDEWPGMDGSDDGYETYGNWPLFYTLGGSVDIHERSRFLWNAVTRQFTEYGQIYNEYDAYYDWMHHGESSTYIYHFGLADPNRPIDRGRAIRFANLYAGKNSPNYDFEKRMIRSPINGSKGPRFENSWEDWSTHRWVLAQYPVPFDDLDVPTEMKPWHGELVPIADWTDDAVYAKILEALNARQMRCDVPLNLTSTSLVTNAFLYTGDERYRRWVLDYLEAWADRIRQNGGICPDNIGPNGIIGETMDGKWWGGYYGWRWPHGMFTIIEPLTIAAMNAVLLTGDLSYLDIPRSQIDKLIELGRYEDGQFLIPHRHTDEGWTSFRPPQPEHISHIWYMSQSETDRARIERFPQVKTTWLKVTPGRGKGDDRHFGPWYSYLHGRLPEYPRLILESQYAEVLRRMDLMRQDDGDPQEWDVHHWQEINPIHTEALIQLTLGGPQIIYHGGLLHVRLRYFDVLERRPGLPQDIAALVSALDAESTTVQLVNTSPLHERRVLLQAGAFGEHHFTEVCRLGSNEEPPIEVDGRHFEVALPPGTTITLKLGMRRYCHQPSYEQPFP
ncbi:MAG: hypothetical protein GXP39_19625 [Chloroflexi bacterium]|nr:hypothetical protein [Chloroflexota bacterium]